MGRRTLLALAVWVAAAVAAMLTGLAAVRVIGDGIGSPAAEPRDARAVAEALASAEAVPPPAPPAARPSRPPPATAPLPPRPAPPRPGPARTLTTPGGTVLARCTDGLVSLLSWTPRPGYATHRADRGPTREAEVAFRGSGDEVEVTVRCGPDGPAATTEIDD